MSVSNPNKTISTTSLGCDGTATVTLSFDAAPELSAEPADIVLIMDRSSSMSGYNLFKAQAGARELIDTVAKASGSSDGKTIMNNSHMGIVTFSTEATSDVALTDDVAALNTAINRMIASGSTNHTAAFEAAYNMLQASTSQRRIIIMFTDGVTTVGGDPVLVTDNIKANGIEIYCIGLTLDPVYLNLWASDPDSNYVAFASDYNQLQKVFAQVAAEVVKAGALDMVIYEALTPDFKITDVHIPTNGSVSVLTPQTLEWTSDAVGVVGTETASLSFDVVYIGDTDGMKNVNQAISYADRQGNTLTFPNPTVNVVCGGSAIIEPCPEPTDFQVDGCRDATVVTTGDVVLTGLGRIVQVNTVVKNVCPGKRVAVAVLLSEVDDEGVEHARGTKTLLIPAQSGEVCQDVQLKCISFVVPESLDVTGNTAYICNARKFAVRILANYVDTDFVCCDAQTAVE